MDTFEIPDINTMSLTDYLTWSSGIKTPFLNVEDLKIPISTRLIWEKHKLFPKLTKSELSNEPVKLFNLFDWVWFQMLVDLENMGINYSTLRKLKSELFNEIDFTLLDGTGITPDAVKKSNPKGKEFINKALDELNERKDVLANPPSLTYIQSSVIDILLTGNPSTILYRYDGYLGILKNSPEVEMTGELGNLDLVEFYNTEFLPHPHLSIGLNKYVNAFLNNYSTVESNAKVGFVNKEEFEVLSLLRNNKLKQLTVKLNQTTNTIKEIEYTVDKDLNEEQFFSLLRSLKVKNYKSISFKSKGNNTVYFEETTRKNLTKKPS